MARKGASKRPSETNLFKSRERIGGYLTALGQPYNKAAKLLGTTEHELKKFLYGAKDQTLKNFPRNKSARRLYVLGGGNIETTKTYEITGYREIKGRQIPQRQLVEKRRLTFEGPIKGVEPYELESGTEDQDRLYKRYLSSIKLERELPSLAMSQEWAKYTSRYDIPVSIEEIKELYAEQELSKRQVTAILNHWHNIYYDMTDDWYETMADEFAAYDEFADE